MLQHSTSAAAREFSTELVDRITKASPDTKQVKIDLPNLYTCPVSEETYGIEGSPLAHAALRIARLNVPKGWEVELKRDVTPAPKGDMMAELMLGGPIMAHFAVSLVASRTA